MDYFYQTLAQVGILALFDKQDGCHNGRHLSVGTYGHSNLVINHQISSRSIIDYFHQTIGHVWILVLSDEQLSSLLPFRQIPPFHCRALCGALSLAQMHTLITKINISATEKVTDCG